MALITTCMPHFFIIIKNLCAKHMGRLGSSADVVKAVQIDPNTRSTRRTDRIQLETSRPDYSGVLAPGLHLQKLISTGRFGFSSRKTRTTERFLDSGQNFQILAKISKFRCKFFRIGQRNPDSGDSFPDSSDISLRSREI